MSRAGTKNKERMMVIPPKPEAVVAYELEQKEEVRVQRLYEQCKYRALGKVLFTDIPQVKGVLLANFMLDMAMQQILIARAGIVVPTMEVPK